VIHPTPPGTRDILPTEMAELRELGGALRAAFEAAGYGQVRTPALEYEDVVRRGDDRAAGAGYRLFDEQGRVLVLRPDMTISVARMVASRLGGREPPFRLYYSLHAYRPIEPRTPQASEFHQVGVELIGPSGPEGDAEVLSLVSRALEAAGLARHRIGLGDGSLYRGLLRELEVPEPERLPLLETLSRRDLVGLEASVDRLGLSPAARRLLVELPTLRGGPEVLARADGPAEPALENLRRCHELLEGSGVAERVIFDLGLVRELGYYTGAVFEIYDPAVGFALGGGGRYDGLLARFGRDLAACGLALDLERVHVALTAEEAQ
jgi:ATP phosphoribosyltransferase regulatory subunit